MTQTAKTEEPIELPTTREQLLAHLEGLGIAYKIYEHPPVFTVAESEQYETNIPGMHCRNLFLYDKKKRMFLITAANETMIDLKKLDKLIESGRLSFCSPSRLWEFLGIKPGSVNPFCIMNDKEAKVRMIIDATMMEADIINVHPMDNAATIGISPQDLLKFMDSIGHKYDILDLASAHPDYEG